MSALLERPEVPVGRRGELIAGLRALLPVDALLHESEDLHPYECDGLSCYRATPLAVAR